MFAPTVRANARFLVASKQAYGKTQFVAILQFSGAHSCGGVRHLRHANMHHQAVSSMIGFMVYGVVVLCHGQDTSLIWESAREDCEDCVRGLQLF